VVAEHERKGTQCKVLMLNIRLYKKDLALDADTHVWHSVHKVCNERPGSLVQSRHTRAYADAHKHTETHAYAHAHAYGGSALSCGRQVLQML
jgi:hypothetical protein